MKTRRRRAERLGKLLFFIPIIVIISVVGYAFVVYTTPGHLTVEAIASNKYVTASSSQKYLEVAAEVTPSNGGKSQTGTTNFTLSFQSGTYEVSYEPTLWYSTPDSKTVQVSSGVTSYAIGVYEVTPDVVLFGDSGFNATSMEALHGVTPVIWVNNSGASIDLAVSSHGSYSLAPGQNATVVFSDAGSFSYQVQNSDYNGTVTVL